MNCDVNVCIVPGPELGVVAGDDIGDIIVEPDVIEDPSGLDNGGTMLIIGGGYMKGHKNLVQKPST